MFLIQNCQDLKFFKKIKYVILIVIVSLLVYNRWLSFSIFTYGDWWFFFNENMKEFLIHSVWKENYSFGNINLVLWRSPLYFLYGLFGNSGLDFNVADKFISIWPIILMPGLSSFLLMKKIVKYDLAAVIGSFVFSYNTYFLSINTQGHGLLTISSGFAVLSIWLFAKALEKKEAYLFILTSITLFITGSYDFRVLYICIFILIFYFFYYLYIIETDRNINNYISVTIFSFLLFLVLFLLNSYWILALLNSNSLLENDVLTRDLFGNEFFNILRSITLFHPFWTGTEPQWFIVQQIPIYFWLIPIFAFGGLFLNRKNKLILFFGIISLIGVLLAKQISEPFPYLYMWLYDHLLGFNAFREASKFYFIIALGYSVLISASVDWFLINWKTNRLQMCGKCFLILLIAFLFLWNTKPLISGEMNTMFVPRSVPNDNLILNEFISSQKEYFRTLWTPRYSRWGMDTNIHPIISNVDTIGSDWKYFVDQQNNWPIQEQIVDIFKQPFSDNLLDISSIKYIIVPLIDIENDNNFFVYYGNNRQFYIDELDKIDYIKKINIGTKDIVVYENENYRPHIYMTFEKETIFKKVPYQNADYRSENPTEYKISLKNITKPVYLVFSEAYHPEWKIRLGNFNWFPAIIDSNYFLSDKYHLKNDAGFNSFLIDPEYIKANYPQDFYKRYVDGKIDIELTLYFRPQSYLYLGGIISSLTFIGCISYILRVLWMKRHRKVQLIHG